MSPLYCYKFAHIYLSDHDIHQHLTMAKSTVKCVLVLKLNSYRNYLYIHCPPVRNHAYKSTHKILFCLHNAQIESMYSDLPYIHSDLHEMCSVGKARTNVFRQKVGANYLRYYNISIRHDVS